MNYIFPVRSVGEALEVTEANFDIKDYPELYVELDKVRIKEDDFETNYLQNIKTLLKVNENNIIEDVSKDYLKILFSGYRGSGKTVEMRRLHEKMLAPERYFSVLIELEKELAINTFQFEDYFILLIYKLANEIEKFNLRTNRLDSIIKEWVSDTEIEKKYLKEAKISNENEVGVGVSFFEFFKAKFNIKTELAAGTETAKTIRMRVKRNPMELVNKFNNALIDIRHDIERLNKGKDILFIIDGSEKIPSEVYERLFIKDADTLKAISANIISTLPIHNLYNLRHHTQLDMYDTFLVPVIKINKESTKLLKQIITKRIPEKRFFDEKVLDFCVEKSGGVVRELTKIVNTAIMYARGNKITMDIAQKTAKIMGKRMDEKLTTKQYNFLQKYKNGEIKRIRVADKEAGELIYSLVLLKYNGDIKIHPLIYDFIKKK